MPYTAVPVLELSTFGFPLEGVGTEASAANTSTGNVCGNLDRGRGGGGGGATRGDSVGRRVGVGKAE